MYSKILLFSGCLFLASSISAQINKGAILVGGNLGFSTQKTEVTDEKTNTFNISPAIGRAIKENLIAGIDLAFSRSLSLRDNVNYYENSFKSYGGGIFLRKYALIANSFYLFGQARIGGYSLEEKQASTTIVYNTDSYGIDLSVYPGIAYAITKKLQLEAGLPNIFSIGYFSRKTTSTQSTTTIHTKSFGASTSLTNGAPLSIGIRLLLNGKNS